MIKQVSGAIDSASEASNPEVIWGALYILTQLEDRPLYLAEVAYRWCIVIWRNRHSYEDWETLLLLSLEVGFRHMHSPHFWPSLMQFHTELYPDVFNTVLNSNNSEAVTDLALASLMIDSSGSLGLNICAEYIVGLHSGATEPFPEDFQRFFILCVGEVGFNGVEKVGKEKFVKSLNRLHLSIEDLWNFCAHDPWTMILLEIVQSTEEAQNLAIQSWELLAELTAEGCLESGTYNLDVATSLMNGKKWDKLECWVGIVWTACTPGPGNVVEVLEDVMEVLEKEQPGAVQKLKQRMERWSKQCHREIPETFQQICNTLAW